MLLPPHRGPHDGPLHQPTGLLNERGHRLRLGSADLHQLFLSPEISIDRFREREHVRRHQALQGALQFRLIVREHYVVVRGRLHRSDREQASELMLPTNFGAHAVHADQRVQHHIRQVAQLLQVVHLHTRVNGQ